jgi:hypothetical protein
LAHRRLRHARARASALSWNAHLAHGNTNRLRRPGQRQHQQRRSPLLSPPPSTLHRQSRWKGFQRECQKGPDPRVQSRSGDRRSPLVRPPPSQRPHDPHYPSPLPHGPKPG